MATATAPPVVSPAAPAAAAPEPEPNPAPAPGPLARILTPVEPARPVQPLGSTATMGQPAEDAGTQGKDGSGKSAPAKGSDRGSPTAALIHALAARLARGGTAVKRTHAITETRVSGTTSTGTGTNKNDRLHKHDAQHKTNRDAKLADLKNKTQAGKTNHDRRQTAGTDAKTASPRAAKSDTAARSDRGGESAHPKAATTVTSSKPDARNPPSSSPKTADAKAAAPASAKAGPTTKTPGPATPAGAAGRPTSPSTPAPGPSQTKPADPKGLNAKTTAAAKRAAVAPAGPTKDASAPAAKKPQAEPAAAAAAPKLRTRPAREAGYRDGTRAAAATGQVRAYKDGVVDGWDDRTAADKAEQRRMDDTRARNAIKPKPKDGPPMKPASGSTTDLEKKATTAPAAVPAQVTAVGGKAIEFAADGASHTMSRGEVRTLKVFERRLVEKKAAMGRVAEGSKATRLQAVEMATRAQRLAESAKGVHGGARIVALLSRLAERTQVLRQRAEEIEKSARRGSEAVTVLAANAETRHGGIYRAVVDSPLTKPAEREFYMDKQGG